MSGPAVDDRVPTAYCARCRAVVFRRPLEEHRCDGRDFAVAIGDYYSGPEEPTMADLARVRERALWVQFLVRLAVVMGALGVASYGLALWWD